MAALASGAGAKASGSFLKKRTKKLCHWRRAQVMQAAPRGRAKEQKFLVLFSKRTASLLPSYANPA
jgi:hypothetical protein